MRPKRLVLLVLALIILLSGCTESASLYALPRTGVEEASLLASMDAVIAQGYELLTLADGSQLQQEDLTGDGNEEAFAFFGDGNSSAKLYVFGKTSETQSVQMIFDCGGMEICSAACEDITGDGTPELLVLSGLPGVSAKILQVYGNKEGMLSELFSEPCRLLELHDLNKDGIRELYCIGDSGTKGQVIPYMAPDGVPVRMDPILLRFGADHIASIQTGFLSDGTEALLISGILEDGTLYTEPVVASERGVGSLTGGMTNLTDALCYTPVRGCYAYPQDIDGDGDTDFPVARELPQYDAGSTVQHVIDWYDFAMTGTQGISTVTYHNFSGGWYLKFPETWWTDITIRETDLSTTLSTVTVYRLTKKGAEEFLTVYEVQGEDPQAFVEEESLTILRSDTERTLALGLSRKAQWLDETVTTASIAERFFVLEEEHDISGNAE